MISWHFKIQHSFSASHFTSLWDHSVSDQTKIAILTGSIRANESAGMDKFEPIKRRLLIAGFWRRGWIPRLRAFTQSYWSALVRIRIRIRNCAPSVRKGIWLFLLPLLYSKGLICCLKRKDLVFQLADNPCRFISQRLEHQLAADLHRVTY